MKNDVLDGMFAALPKSFKNFDRDFNAQREEAFYSHIKLKNDEDSIENVPFSPEYVHYKHCIPAQHD